MKTIDEVREVLIRVRDQVGIDQARDLILKVGGAPVLRYVDAENYDALFAAANKVLGIHDPVARLNGASALLLGKFSALLNSMESQMAALDDLKTAVDQSVAEMNRAADFIRNHPAASNDTALQDMASRLSAAATALAGVDTTGTATSSGTVSSAGTVADTGTVANTGTAGA